MKKYIILLALFIPSFSSVSAKTAEINKYGHELIQKEDGSYEVKGLKNICKRDPEYAAQEGICEPFKKPESVIADREAIRTVKSKDYVYKTYPDGRTLSITIDFAKMDKPAPVLFVTHGGSWKRGSRSSFNEITRTLAANEGITSVRIQYSFIGMGVTMEDTEQDVLDAVKFVLDRAKEFNINPKRIGFMGNSAGGHLAAFAALSFPHSRVLVGQVGPYDIEYLFETSKRKKTDDARAFFGDFDLAFLRKISPYHMLLAGAPCKNLAALLIQGTCDTTVDFQQALNFETALKEHHARKVQLLGLRFSAHGINSTCYRQEIERTEYDFIVRYL